MLKLAAFITDPINTLVTIVLPVNVMEYFARTNTIARDQNSFSIVRVSIDSFYVW